MSDPAIELELLYIDDLVFEMLDALEGREHRCEFDGLIAVPCDTGRFCAVPATYRVTLGEIVTLLESFKAQPQTLVMPEIPAGSFATPTTWHGIPWSRENESLVEVEPSLA